MTTLELLVADAEAQMEAPAPVGDAAKAVAERVATDALRALVRDRFPDAHFIELEELVLNREGHAVLAIVDRAFRLLWSERLFGPHREADVAFAYRVQLCAFQILQLDGLTRLPLAAPRDPIFEAYFPEGEDYRQCGQNTVFGILLP